MISRQCSAMSKKIIISFIAAVLIFLQISSSQAFQGKSSKYILDNGLTVLISEMPSNPSVSVYALVKTGSATEGDLLGSGVSHFLEHLLFKGTENRKLGEIAAQVQAVGGSINAATSMDYTIYTITVPSDAFDMALAIQADMMQFATMDAEEIEKERDVVFGEMRLHEDRPSRHLSQLTFQNVYIRHPYRHPIIGYKPLFIDLTRDDIMQYYRDFYIPNNTIVSIAGNVNTQEVLPKIKDAFESFRRQTDIPRNLPEEPQQISPRYYEEEFATNLTRFTLSFNSMSLLNEDLFALDVLAKILGQGKTSRLYRALDREGVAFRSISAGNYTPIDKGLFEIVGLLEPEYLDAIMDITWKQIENIKTAGVKKVELEKAKKQVLSEHILGHQTTSQVAYAQAVDEAFTGDYQFSQKYVDAIADVEMDAIKRVAHKYLRKQSSTVVVLKPKGQKDVLHKDEEAQHFQEDKIQKHVLKNGLTLLLRKDATFPSTALRIVVNGGTRQENVMLNGISKLTSMVWLKGTKALSADQIANKAESLGMQLGSYSGKNSFGLSLDFLSEDMDEALRLVKDIIINPNFPEAEIVKRKRDLKADIKQRDDNIAQFTGHALKELTFEKHPFRLEEEGTEESIDRITRENIMAFYEKLVVPNNMVLSIFGNITSEDILSKVKKALGDLKKNEVQLAIHKETPIEKSREKSLTMKKQQAMLAMGFHGITMQHKDRYGLEVLTSILGSSFSGRLFTRIREELGQAYTLGGYSAPGIDAGLIYFYVLTTAEKVPDAKKALKNEIERIQREYVSDEELKDIKAYLKGIFKTSHQTNSALNFTSSLNELYGLGFNHHQEYDTLIDRVTKEDIKRLANEYLDLNKSAIVVTRPVVEKQEVRKQEVQK